MSDDDATRPLTEATGGPQWVYVKPPERRGPRAWVVVLLVLVALAIVGGVVWFFMNAANSRPEPVATGTPTPTASASATPSATATPTPTLTPSATPTVAPTATPPVVEPPDLNPFRDQVRDRINDATTGLDMISTLSATEASNVVDSLIIDAQNLADQYPPVALQDSWRAGVNDYLASLTSLQSALDGGSASSGPLADARADLQSLKDLIGL